MATEEKEESHLSTHECAESAWDGVNFLHSRQDDATFRICD